MTRQSKLFDDTDTLPLFAGTPQRTNAAGYEHKDRPTQRHLGQCPVCEDTGIISTKYEYKNGRMEAVGRRFCTCEAGQRLHQQQKEK